MGRLALVGLWMGLTALAWAAPPVSLASLVGEVTVVRAGVLIPSEQVAEGFALEPFDTVTTGPTGRADVRLAAGVVGSLRLDGSTSLYLEFVPLLPQQTFGVSLITGGLSVNLTSLLGSSSVEVVTEAASFSSGVPGFRLVSLPEGDVLVTSRSHAVACRVGSRVLYADSSMAVEVLARDQGTGSLPVNAATLPAFETSWTQQREQAFRDQLAQGFRTTASVYQRQMGYFQRAWDRYQREAGEPRVPMAATAQLRRAAFALERTLATLGLFRKALDEGVLSPTLELSRGYPAQDFFRQAARDEVPWWGRLAEARSFYRTVAEKNGGLFPRAADGSGITWDSPYFH